MNYPNKYRILAVDDSADNCDIILNCFSADYIVHIARNGEAALVLLDKIKPDIILLDIIMPGLDGFELCSRIKTRKELVDVPVLFLTVKSDADEVVAGFKAGAADYITKPFNLDELSARVELHLELKRNRDELIKINNDQCELLHILHHDLSNTFMSLSAQTTFLENEMKSTSSYLAQIKSNVKNGCEIIHMVRVLGESHTDSMNFAALNLKTSLEKSIAILEHMFQEKDITLKLNADQDCYIYAEESSLINSVLNNLLTNAVKFSFSGSVIEIDIREDAETVALFVEDHGIGMPAQMVESLFESSKPLSRKGTNGEEGTGFGMPLVQKFLNYYDASIAVRSRDIHSYPDTHGTVFEIHFHKGDYAG